MKLTTEQKKLVVKMAAWLMENRSVLATNEGNKAVGLMAKIVSKGEYNHLEKDVLNQIREKYVRHIKEKPTF